MSFAGQLVLGRADLVEQFVECFGGELLACGERTKDIDQKQANAKNLRQATHRSCDAPPQLAQDHVAHPFATGNAFCAVAISVDQSRFFFGQLECSASCLAEDGSSLLGVVL